MKLLKSCLATSLILGIATLPALAKGKYYYLEARHSGQCLNVLNYGQNNGDNVVQGKKCDTTNFQWKLIPTNDGYYYLKARHSGQCLNVLNYGQNNGDNVVQGKKCNTTNFQWKFRRAS